MVVERPHNAHQQVNFSHLKEINAKARKNARDVFVNFFTHLVLEPPKKCLRGNAPLRVFFDESTEEQIR